MRELAAWLEAPFEGDGDSELKDVASLDAAGPHDLSFVGSRKGAVQAAGSKAGCLMVPAEFPNPGGRAVIRVQDPRTAFARAIGRLHPAVRPTAGIHATAVVAPGASISPEASIGAQASIGEGTVIGPRVSIGPGCAIGRQVRIGEDSVLHANVTIYDDVEMGRRTVLHSGCVIGADGFGFAMAGDHWEKFPQVGRVVIGDDVEIGANSCVDRAALGVTSVGDGTKLDNMVHVAHNCTIGRHVVVAAQTGFSGGVTVGDYAVIGGQVGIGDKARIESRAVLGSGCGILTSKIVRAGEPVWGVPARPLREHLEQLASLSRLPELRKEVRELRRRLEELEAQAGAVSSRRT